MTLRSAKSDYRPSLHAIASTPHHVATTRRHVLYGLASCAMCGALFNLAPAGAAARTLDDVEGCFLIGRDTRLVDGRVGPVTTILQGPVVDESTITRTTGDRATDVDFDKSLTRLAKTFGVYPSFAFFEDDKPNAFALPESSDRSRTGRVLFGKKLFKELQEMDPSGVSVLGVAAHEFAHIWQYESGSYRTIRGDAPTAKRVELNADFLAGYYLGLRKTAHPSAHLWGFGEELSKLGDQHYTARDHHGTPQERTDAAEAGFKLSYCDSKTMPACPQADMASAFQASMAYVAAL